MGARAAFGGKGCAGSVVFTLIRDGVSGAILRQNERIAKEHAGLPGDFCVCSKRLVGWLVGRRSAF
jgi:hypothetical protein